MCPLLFQGAQTIDAGLTVRQYISTPLLPIQEAQATLAMSGGRNMVGQSESKSGVDVGVRLDVAQRHVARLGPDIGMLVFVIPRGRSGAGTCTITVS